LKKLSNNFFAGLANKKLAHPVKVSDKYGNALRDSSITVI